MKSISIGDLHGDDTWKNVNLDNYDLEIFLGDYVDDFNHTSKEIVQNFEDIIYHKKQNPDKVKLLIGNHDAQYFTWGTEWHKRIKCSGFRNNYLFKIYNLYIQNVNLFEPSFQIDNYLWSHAGLSNKSFKLYFENKKLENETMSEMINRLWKCLDGALFPIGNERGGDSEIGSIFWMGLGEVGLDMLNNYHQIVGHTPVGQINKFEKDENTSMTFIDTRLGNKEFLELEI